MKLSTKILRLMKIKIDTHPTGNAFVYYPPKKRWHKGKLILCSSLPIFKKVKNRGWRWDARPRKVVILNKDWLINMIVKENK